MTSPTLAILGSTGSIGTQALDVVAAHPDRWEVTVLGANASVHALAAQAQVLRPAVVVLVDPGRAAELAPLLPPATELWVGPEALAAAAATADVVLNAVVGFAGLGVTMAALGAGRRLALANKESLVAGGPVVRAVVNTPGAELVPVDSEHCAIHQCLRSAAGRHEVARLVLTASGGPFRQRPAAELDTITVAEALAHPTWRMGPKITVDSSTLMNKGLEVLEAAELFDLAVDVIDVVVHPQSIVHSMVTFTDGSTLAQLSEPDMRLPIAYALGYPNRTDVAYGALDWTTARSLEFEPPDRARFGCLELAYTASRLGGTAPAWLNGANEATVDAFLAGRIRWVDIAAVLRSALDRHDGGKAETIFDVVQADGDARNVVADLLDQRRHRVGVR